MLQQHRRGSWYVDVFPDPQHSVSVNRVGRHPTASHWSRLTGNIARPEVDQRNRQLMGRVERTREIARRRARKVKLEQLRAKYAKATGESEKSLILTKARKLSPFVEFEN